MINISLLNADKKKRLNFVSGLVECDKSGYVFSSSGEVCGNRLSLSTLGQELVTYAVTINEGYIDMSHLCAQHTINFEKWLARLENQAVLQKYVDATGLGKDDLICRNKANGCHYVLPGLCLNFLDDCKPEIGELMRTMMALLRVKASIETAKG